MAEIKDYSVTADDNNATSPAGMPENMAPSGVNNSWRESFARVKRWYEDINGTKSTTGSSNAYVLAAARTVTAYAQGDAYMFRANHTNTGAVTLNVDSVGAVAIVNNTQSALAAGQIQSGGMYLVAYDASNSKFQLVGASATSASGDNIFIFNASPSATLENSTAEDTAGGRESTIQWKGLQSGSEESTLVKIIGSHDGTADDQKGKLQIYTNDGSDGDSPTLQVTIDSAGLCALVGAATIGGSLTVTGVTTHGGNVVSDTDSTDDLGTTSVRWANLFVDGITATDQITATGFTGTLDGILGSGAAAAATVTTLDTSGVVNLNLTTDSSSSTSGALIIDGGVGIAKKLFVGTDADIDGNLEADGITLGGTALGSLYSPIAGSSSIVTTGALNSGSITSGFGAIDNGASAITTTGVITGGTVEATTDTAAGDNAAIGYTAAEGLILTGQGSTSDITFKNDADATVFSIPTGTDDILFPDSAKAMFGAASDLKIFHDGSNSYIEDSAGTGVLYIKTNDLIVQNAAGNEDMLRATQDNAVTLYHNNVAKLATQSTGVHLTGGFIGGSGAVASTGSWTGSGDVVFHTTSPSLNLGAFGVVVSHTYRGVFFTNASWNVFDENNAGVYLNGGQTSWTATSDERIKKNITELNGSTAYNHVKAARAVTFNWKQEDHDTKVGKKIGFIAQDWETAYPEVVDESLASPQIAEEIDGIEADTQIKGIQYTETIPVLMAALKEAIAKIEVLETKVAALEAS